MPKSNCPDNIILVFYGAYLIIQFVLKPKLVSYKTFIASFVLIYGFCLCTIFPLLLCAFVSAVTYEKHLTKSIILEDAKVIIAIQLKTFS